MTWHIRKVSYLYIIVVAGLGAFLFQNKDLFVNLKYLSFIDLLFLLFLSFIILYLNASQSNYIIKVFNVDLKFIEWFGLAVTNTMHNYYLPARGGTVLKAVYLKKSRNFAYSTFISLTTGAYIFSFFMAALSAILFILLSFFVYGKFYSQVFFISTALLFSALFAGLIVMRLDISHFLKSFPRLQNFVYSVEKGLGFFLKKNKLLIRIFLIQFLMIVMESVKLFWAYLAIGIEVNFVSILIVQSLVIFSMVLSITPGNLGVREGIIGLLASFLGIPLNEAVLGALVDRAVSMSLIILLGLIFTKILNSELDKQLVSVGKEHSGTER